jgi:hypothetical protein
LAYNQLCLALIATFPCGLLFKSNLLADPAKLKIPNNSLTEIIEDMRSEAMRSESIFVK